MDKAFNYENISLIPRVVSTLDSRLDADPSVKFGPYEIGLPLITAPMPDVSESMMALFLAQKGVLSIIHRFMPIDEQVRFFKDHKVHVGAAVGVVGDFKERFIYLYEEGCVLFCLDTANGAHSQVEKAINWIRSGFPEVFIIAGNVASKETFSWLEECGAHAIRVGIAGGGVCETKTETGCYVPTPFAVHEAASVRKEALIIGDGGVKTPSDVCKLLALGADVVMMGSVFAGSAEAPGSVIMSEGNKYKILRGAASYSVQQQVKNNRPQFVEGSETLVPYKGSVGEIVDRFSAGIRSSMSYMNARTLEEYRNNCSLIEL